MRKKITISLMMAFLLTACKVDENNNSAVGKNAGPFGVSMGMSAKDLKAKIPSFTKDTASYTYGSDSGITENNLFNTYRYVITPETGVCEVGATTAAFDTNSTGDQIIEKFRGINQIIENKYGAPHYKIEKASPTAYYDSKTELTKALYYNQYSLIWYWDATKQGKTFVNDIERIVVIARAANTRQGQIVVNYIFKNQKECESAKLKLDSSGM